MSRWSESIYSEPNTSRDSQHGFLTELDARLYEGVPMNDPQLDAEAGEWAARFIHLRIRGVKCHISTGKPDGGARNGGARKVPNEIVKEVATETSRTHPGGTSPMKKSSNSATISLSTSDHLPRLKDLKR
ncbi:hypothetical protein GCK32_009148 [Trichostrongylus colubriformis]|uniref:DUF3719 domain-containing protein n=1 Tax=Trichostrongylus colubriformis TaxID=6319 RepID=A0AAN8G2G2_TRICO